MIYNITVQIEALLKIQDAVDWYEEQKQGLGFQLLDEIENCYAELQINPHRFSFINHQYRRVKTARFPYVLIYEVEDDTVIITNVRHNKQKPL